MNWSRNPRLALIALATVAGLPLSAPAAPYAAAIPPAEQIAEMPAASVTPGAVRNEEHHTGKVVWLDLVTSDVATARAFYGGLLGWTFRPLPGARGSSCVALLDGEPVAAILQSRTVAAGQRRPAWLPFLAVDDIAKATQRAVADGAKLLIKPRDEAQRGWLAVLADPDGAVFGMLASRDGDTPDVLPEPGDWIWHSLRTHKADEEAAFYQQVFGYDAFELPSPDGSMHVMLSSDDYARASADGPPPGSAAPPAGQGAQWFNFVRVTNATQSAQRAVALGGRILVEAHLDRHGEHIAVVSDPAGAVIGLMEWTADREPAPSR